MGSRKNQRASRKRNFGRKNKTKVGTGFVSTKYHSERCRRDTFFFFFFSVYQAHSIFRVPKEIQIIGMIIGWSQMRSNKRSRPFIPPRKKKKEKVDICICVHHRRRASPSMRSPPSKEGFTFEALLPLAISSTKRRRGGCVPPRLVPPPLRRFLCEVERVCSLSRFYSSPTDCSKCFG